VIDWDRVNELRDEVGAEAFDEILAVFLDEMDAAVGRLAEHPPADAEGLRAELHFLKGSGLNLGLSDFAALCAAGEDHAAAGATVDLAPILDSYRATRAELVARTSSSD